MTFPSVSLFVTSEILSILIGRTMLASFRISTILYLLCFSWINFNTFDIKKTFNLVMLDKNSFPWQLTVR